MGAVELLGPARVGLGKHANLFDDFEFDFGHCINLLKVNLMFTANQLTTSPSLTCDADTKTPQRTTQR